jgi:hypothetical protein
MTCWRFDGRGQHPVQAACCRLEARPRPQGAHPEEYERHLRLHVLPYLCDALLSQIAAEDSRVADRAAGRWHRQADRCQDVPHPARRRRHAVDDDPIRRNPSRIKGEATAKAEEQPIATLDQVFAIAAAILLCFVRSACRGVGEVVRVVSCFGDP